MLTEVRGKVLSEKNAFKSVKIALLLSNDIDADRCGKQLFAYKQKPFLIDVLAKFHK